MFGGEWAHARRLLQLPFDDFSDRRTLALVYPAGTPLDELPKEGGVLEGGASWVRSKASKVAWNRRSELSRQAHKALVRDLFLIADHLNVQTAIQLKAALAASKGVEPGVAELVPVDFKDLVSPHLPKMAVKRAPVRSQRTDASMDGLLQSPPGSEWSGDFTRKTLAVGVDGFNYAVLFVCTRSLNISIYFTETKTARDLFKAIEALRVSVAG